MCVFFAFQWAKISKQCEKSALVFLRALPSRFHSFRKEDPMINSLGLIFQVEGRTLDDSSGSAAVPSGRWFGFQGVVLIDWIVWITSTRGERESCCSWRHRKASPFHTRRHTNAHPCTQGFQHKRTNNQTNAKVLTSIRNTCT